MRNTHAIPEAIGMMNFNITSTGLTIAPAIEVSRILSSVGSIWLIL
ncbi:hypothetical protein [Galbibacter marinus]|nr:hypothetical protein [Galbibacter marinus]